MGRSGRASTTPAAEAFSSLEWEVLSRNAFRDTIQAQAVVIDWCYTFYNHQRRHEIRESRHQPGSGIGNPPRFRGDHTIARTATLGAKRGRYRPPDELLAFLEEL